jgi:pyrroloquinoline quinone (PQQ) biosynthesis protein C
MSASAVMHHKFLGDFETKVLTESQLKRFAIQWYKTARNHKEAFPALVYNTPNDDIRFDLIDILNEEYGNGNREQIHTRLLKRFLTALEISDQDIDEEETLPAVRRFGDEVLRIWKDGHPVYAFGLHFSLEFLAASLHSHFADGLQKYPFLTDYQREYFNYHKTAEQQHADFSENGMLTYASDPEAQALLLEGIDKGIELLGDLWDGFQAHIFKTTA